MSESRRNVECSDICGNKIVIQNPKKVGTAGKAKQMEGVKTVSWLDCNHKEDNIDRIVKEYGQGTGYAKWQNEKYPVKVDTALIRARMMGKVGKDGYVR